MTGENLKGAGAENLAPILLGILLITTLTWWRVDLGLSIKFKYCIKR